MISMSAAKRDGRNEAFIPERIVVSAVKPGATPEFARTVAQPVGKNAKDENIHRQDPRCGSNEACIGKFTMDAELESV